MVPGLRFEPSVSTTWVRSANHSAAIHTHVEVEAVSDVYNAAQHMIHLRTQALKVPFQHVYGWTEEQSIRKIGIKIERGEKRDARVRDSIRFREVRWSDDNMAQ